MDRGRILIRQLFTAAALAATLLLSACAPQSTSAPDGSPAALATAAGGEISTPQSPGSGSPPGADQMATSEAALDNSGRSGPTLPPGDQPPAEPPETIATPTSASVQANTGGVVTPNQATPDDSQATRSPDQLATSEAALENSGKTGPTPQGDPAQPASNCLGSAGLMIVVLAMLVLRRYSP